MQFSFLFTSARYLRACSAKLPTVLRMAVAIGLTAMLFSSSLVLTGSAYVESPKSTVEDVDSFIIENVNGVASCRHATHEEVPLTIPHREEIDIPAQQLRLKDAPNQLQAAGENATTGLTIDRDPLSQLSNDPNSATVLAAIDRAIAVWTSRIKSPVTIQLFVDYGNNFPNGDPFPNGVLASTSSRRTLIDYQGARINLLASASSAAETTLYNRLPTGFVPTDVGNGGIVSVSRSVALALGIPVASSSDPNVATISFNKKFPYDFNPDDGIDFNKTDFVAVAVHEIGHALGFISNAGAGTFSNPSLWDLYRFRPGTTTTTFTNAERVMDIGGEQVHFTGDTFTVAGLPTTELRLSTGGPKPEDGDGDQRQSSHWKDDSLNSGRFIGIMDPNIGPGVREEATENDFAALEAIGWNLVAAVPPPPPPPPVSPPANDNFANAQAITGCSGSVTGTNLAATRESGEQNHEPDDNGGARSVWYSWQAPSSGGATISTTGSRFDTVLGVYTGNAVNSLSPVTQLDGTVGKDDDDNGGVDKTSTVIFNASAGTIYKIAVDGYDNQSGGDVGPITLNWNCAPPLQLMLDQSGPAADQAAALDSILFLRDPFLVDNATNLFYTLGDRNTRILVFVAGLQLSAPSAVTLNLVDSSNQTHNVSAQDLRSAPNQAMTQITFRLPDNLPAGTCKIKVITTTQVSNTATIRIRTN